MVAALAITAAVAAWALTYHLYLGHTGFGFMLVFYVFVAAMVVFYMASAALSGNYSRRPVAPGRMIAVIASYNETDEALHATIRGLLNSVRPPDQIHVMDDGSTTWATPYDDPRVIWHRQANMGKRYAQANVLRYVRDQVAAGREVLPDFIYTGDSDSVVDPHATDQLLRAFSDPAVQGTTGLILVRNRTGNVLAGPGRAEGDRPGAATRAARAVWLALRTRGANALTCAQDLDIGTSCLLVRTSRSVLGAVSPTSGAMAMYRAPVLLDNLDDYVNSGTNGDDRRLSLYSLVRQVRLPNGKIVNGRVVAVNTAHVYTDMPVRPGDLWRQRLRWGKSGWQSLPFEITNLSFVPLAFRLYALALAVVLPIMYVWVAVSVAVGGHYGVLFVALAASMVIRYGETSLYAMIRPGLTGWQRLRMWLVMTPVAFAMNWFIIRPAKYVSLTQLNKRGWVTRGNAHGTTAVRRRVAPRRLVVQLGAAMLAVLAGGAVLYAGVSGDDRIDKVVTQGIGPVIAPLTGAGTSPSPTMRPTTPAATLRPSVVEPTGERVTRETAAPARSTTKGAVRTTAPTRTVSPTAGQTSTPAGVQESEPETQTSSPVDEVTGPPTQTSSSPEQPAEVAPEIPPSAALDGGSSESPSADASGEPGMAGV